jgi:hypothetical protein
MAELAWLWRRLQLLATPKMPLDAPFYLLLTDCINTLRQLAPVHPMLSELRQLFARQGASLPPDPRRPFRHGMAIFARQAGDAISTIGLMDPDPKSGSITFYAGWQVNGKPYGAPMRGTSPFRVSYCGRSSMTHGSPAGSGATLVLRR